MPKFKSEFVVSAATLICFAGGAAAQCPSVQNGTERMPGTPLMPAVTRIEIENPSAPSKPYPAVPTSPTDRAQTTGGVIGKSSLTLIVTLSSEVASGCELPFSVFDSVGPIINQRQLDSETTFPALNFASRPYTPARRGPCL